MKMGTIRHHTRQLNIKQFSRLKKDKQLNSIFVVHKNNLSWIEGDFLKDQPSLAHQ